MREYTPDSWVIIKVIGVDNDFYKVLVGWSGGYLDGDRWRINSGIDKIEFDGEYYYFTGRTGSVYKCHKDSNQMRFSMVGTWNGLKEKYPDNIKLVEIDEVIDALK